MSEKAYLFRAFIHILTYVERLAMDILCAYRQAQIK